MTANMDPGQGPLAPNMLGTLDFTGSEHWAPCNIFLKHSLISTVAI